MSLCTDVRLAKPDVALFCSFQVMYVVWGFESSSPRYKPVRVTVLKILVFIITSLQAWGHFGRLDEWLKSPHC